MHAVRSVRPWSRRRRCREARRSFGARGRPCSCRRSARARSAPPRARRRRRDRRRRSRRSPRRRLRRPRRTLGRASRRSPHRECRSRCTGRHRRRRNEPSSLCGMRTTRPRGRVPVLRHRARAVASADRSRAAQSRGARRRGARRVGARWCVGVPLSGHRGLRRSPGDDGPRCGAGAHDVRFADDVRVRGPERADHGVRRSADRTSATVCEHERTEVMQPCSRCHRHLRFGTTTCPFCKSRRERVVSTAVAVIALASAVGTTACYGGPSKHDRAYSPPPEPSASAPASPSK